MSPRRTPDRFDLHHDHASDVCRMQTMSPWIADPWYFRNDALEDQCANTMHVTGVGEGLVQFTFL